MHRTISVTAPAYEVGQALQTRARFATRRSLIAKTFLAFSVFALVIALHAVTSASPAAAQGSTRIWTNKGQYTIGESMQVCYSVPGPGPFRIVDILADGRSQTFFSGTDDGRGGCIPGQVTEPAGKERMRLEVVRSGAVIASAETSFQVSAAVTLQVQAQAQPVPPPPPVPQPRPAVPPTAPAPSPVACPFSVALASADGEYDVDDTNNEDPDGSFETALAPATAAAPLSVPVGPGTGGCGGRLREHAIRGAINRANHAQAYALRYLETSRLGAAVIGDAYHQMVSQVEALAWSGRRTDCRYLGVSFRNIQPGFDRATAHSTERWSCDTYDTWSGALLSSDHYTTFNTYELVRNGRFWYVSRFQTIPI